MNRKKRMFKTGLGIVISLLTMACRPGYMVPTTAEVTTSPERATVVFYRPSRWGGANTSAVYDVTAEDTVFFGGVKGGGKVVAQVAPGNHIFMVSGENADFSYATLEAGKLYYMRIQTRMGFGKMRYSLNPIHSDMIGEARVKVNACERFEKNGKSDSWFQKHRASIEEKRQRYFKKWMTKPEANRPRLRASDNVQL